MTDVTHVHQILIVDHMGPVAPLPDAIRLNIESVISTYPKAQHRLWDGASLRQFLSQSFEPAVLEAFDTLAPYSYKSDLGRYCLLYALGGLYVDVGVRCIRPLVPPAGCSFAGFREVDFATGSWTALQSAIIWAKPGREELRLAINYVLDHCSRRTYGATPIHPTGPIVIGRAVADAAARSASPTVGDEPWIGVTRALTPEAADRNVCYLTPDRALVALRMKGSDAGLSHLGLSGGNNYDRIWRSRRAYGEPTSVWSFADPDLRMNEFARRTETGLSLAPNVAGLAIFGPYVDLEPGRYRLFVRFRGPGPLPRMQVEWTRSYGNQVIGVQAVARRRAAPAHDVVLDFDVGDLSLYCEFRLYFYEHSTIELSEIVLASLGQ